MHYAYVGQGVKWDMHLLLLFYQFPDAAGGERARFVLPKCSSLRQESDFHIIPRQLKPRTQSESILCCGVIETVPRLCWSPWVPPWVPTRSSLLSWGYSEFTKFPDCIIITSVSHPWGCGFPYRPRGWMSGIILWCFSPLDTWDRL
jgi:hypothetical protein